MTFFDILVVLITLLSAVAGFVRGGAREMVTLFAFSASAIVAFLCMPVTGPLFRKLIDPDYIGTIVSVLFVFVLVYFAVHALGNLIREKLHQSDQLGGVDRFVGLTFGVLRALVVLGVFHLLYSAVTPPQRQGGWFLNARLYGLSAASAKTIQAVLPKAAKGADALAPRVERSVRRGASDAYDPDPGELPAKRPTAATTRPQSKTKSARAYDERQRDRMDALVENAR
jgi:membrane protein required for colicin V production